MNEKYDQNEFSAVDFSFPDKLLACWVLYWTACWRGRIAAFVRKWWNIHVLSNCWRSCPQL